MPTFPQKLLQRLQADLASPAGRDRLQTVRDLAPVAGLPAIRRLLESLASNDSDPRVRFVAAEVIRDSRAPEPAESASEAGETERERPPLRQVLARGGFLERLEALETAGPGDELAVLEAHAGSATEPLEAAWAVEQLARAAGRGAAPVLRALARDSRARVAAAALESLAAVDGPQARPELEAGLTVSAGLVRRASARALHSLAPEDALRHLETMLFDPERPGLREAAQDGLAAIGTPAAVALLGRAIGEDPELVLAERAAGCLGKSASRAATGALGRARELPEPRGAFAEKALETLRPALGLSRPAFEALVRRSAQEPPERAGQAPADALTLARAHLARPALRRPALLLSAAAICLVIGLLQGGPPEWRDPASRPGLPSAGLEAAEPDESGDLVLSGTLAGLDRPGRRLFVLPPQTSEPVQVSMPRGLSDALTPGCQVRLRLRARPDGTLVASSADLVAAPARWSFDRPPAFARREVVLANPPAVRLVPASSVAAFPR